MAQKGINIPENWHQNLDGSYDVEGTVYITKEYVSNGRLRIKFGKVSDKFYCSRAGLTSLEGCPREVGGSFDCEENELKTLKGAPKIVGKNFYCSQNQLISLEGAPNIVNGRFECCNNQLTTLCGAPKYVKDTFICKYNLLSNLEGSPIEVGNFNCSHNKLVTVTGAPKYIWGDFDLSSNPLRDLSDIPEIGGDLYAFDTNYYILQEDATIKAQELPLLLKKGVHQDITIKCIDWSGFTRSLYEYTRWIPRGFNIRHINLTSTQQKELHAIKISRI